MEEFYDIFYYNKHSGFFEKKLLKYNYNLLKYIVNSFKVKMENISILEIGPGKGYFHKACLLYNRQNKTNILDYYAFDRNNLMLDSLNIAKDKCFVGEAPDLSAIGQNKFDIVFCAYVAEHLKNGHEVYSLIKSIKSVLKPGGMIVLLTPNAVKQKMEFWNIDYTHIYPTTKRNVAMAFYDNSITDLTVIDINGLVYHRFFYNKLLYYISRFLLFFYNYKFFSFIFGLIYREPIYSLDNFFYRLYCFAKEENLIFISKSSI